MNQTERALHNFIAIMRTKDSIENVVRQDVKQYGLNLTEFAVLELLYSKGEQPIQKIGDKILIASSSTTYVVDKLVAKHLVERCVSSNDRRVYLANLTQEGERLMQDIFPKHAKTIEQIFSTLNEEEMKQLQRILLKVNQTT
ncbi:MarR family winged helix-turn-helix transcriptional regulator [Vagococcus xieshaowenii]|uniref:MarR family transcriptional regulator n=1 Tax=Vagococcus xieshaowenii TaxID=2562451 RepID=A0AAJ5JQC7_9ENTE|nr:MarR family transcriptional regulator [Vagococcus xieshaowenii]QCA28669.1 MarR family transcriptional regulator [Vagococcus xieshaowenii]TFZ40523.1 MarR family transcriptional regulator [Vagococcus xieshaowenii]